MSKRLKVLRNDHFFGSGTKAIIVEIARPRHMAMARRLDAP
jgi:hypothetical protein